MDSGDADTQYDDVVSMFQNLSAPRPAAGSAVSLHDRYAERRTHAQLQHATPKQEDAKKKVYQGTRCESGNETIRCRGRGEVRLHQP